MRKVLAVRVGDERDMREGASGLRGGAFLRAGKAPVPRQAGPGAADRGPMASTEEKGEGEDAAGEGVAVTPGTPQEVDPL